MTQIQLTGDHRAKGSLKAAGIPRAATRRRSRPTPSRHLPALPNSPWGPPSPSFRVLRGAGDREHSNHEVLHPCQLLAEEVPQGQCLGEAPGASSVSWDRRGGRPAVRRAQGALHMAVPPMPAVPGHPAPRLPSSRPGGVMQSADWPPCRPPCRRTSPRPPRCGGS